MKTATSTIALLATGEVPQRPLGYANLTIWDSAGRAHNERVPLYKHGGTSLTQCANRFRLNGIEVRA